MAFNLVDLDFFGVREVYDSYNFNSSAGQNGEEREIELKYLIVGSPDESSDFYFATDTAAKNYFRAWFIDNFGSPVYFSGLPLKSWSFESTENANVWRASLSFGFQETNDDSQQHKSGTPPTSLDDCVVGLSDINWSFSTNSQNIKNTLQTVGGWSCYSRTIPTGGGDRRFVWSENIVGGESQGETETTETEFIMRDFGGRLAVNSDGEAEGVDVLRPSCSFSVTCRIIPAAPFNPFAILQHVGTTNSDNWGGVFGAREVLFVGCDIKRVVDNVPNSSGDTVKTWLTEITFNFQYNPTVYFSAPDGKQILKRGFDILWTYQTPAFDPNTQAATSKTMQVNLERVYPVANFSAVFPWVWSI